MNRDGSLIKDEHDSLRSQFGTLKRGEHSKYMPMAFIGQEIAMLSGIDKGLVVLYMIKRCPT
jgi:hypothetical protein